MLDERTKLMLDVANELTAADIEFLKGAETTRLAPGAATRLVGDRQARGRAANDSRQTSPSSSAGEYERGRTRESKISTACVGVERAKHTWWPVGTELAGRIGTAEFTAEVVENPQVKSGRSILLTSGAANGHLCITPTRAALEATEAYRQDHGLGRGGGVTNGWLFWQPKA
ncbi:MAG: hypothetical protein J5J06_15585 [Phycisphaerae bacterium]|nr:hypothetical protein [Phycisphaerae bacterium]